MTDIVDPVLEAYAEAHTTPPPPHLVAVAIETQDTLDFPGMMVGTLEGRFLEMLVFAQRPRWVLEIGTFSGYSALAMAAGLPPDGRITTCELNPAHAEVALRNIATSPYAGRIEVIEGPALQTVTSLDGPFDFVFIDADKVNTPEYFTWALELSHPGTMIIADNVIRDGRVIDPASEEPSVQGSRRLHDLIASEPRVSATTIQTVGLKGYDGFTLALVN